MTANPWNTGNARDAVISDCVRYRYALWERLDGREHGPGFRWLVVTMLNPSKADAQLDDPTIRRVRAFCRAWGYGGFIVVNLFAYRATDPDELAKVVGAIGPENDAWLTLAAAAADLLVCAWGARGGDRARKVARMLARPLHVIRLTSKTRVPEHPLYLPGDLQPVAWTP